jgi:hypothetical protein
VVYYLVVLTLTFSFQGDGIGVLVKRPQVPVEARLSLTNKSEGAVSHSNFHVMGVLIYATASGPC